MRAICELLDHPEISYPTIHIAGTNGKSTTARIVAAILAAHGPKVGVYTSPHLQTIRERFALVGASDQGFASELIDKEVFARLVEYLRAFVDIVENDKGQTVTYFEWTTTVAFEWMSQIPVDVGVFETGMGGTWDATNLVRPDVSVVTHIALDHERFLGSTQAEIAREKAGIIKDAPVVVGPQLPEVLGVLADKASETGARTILFDRDFSIASTALAHGGRTASITGVYATYDDLFLPLHGAHQVQNLAVAIATVESFLGRELAEDSVQSGLSTVKSPGRMEVVRHNPLVLLDGAHNPDGAWQLAPAIEETFGDRSRTLIVSISEGKDANGILAALSPLANRILLTRHSSYPSIDPAELASTPALEHADVELFNEMKLALDEALSTSRDEDMVIVTGSLYGVGEARELIVGPAD